MTRPVSAAITAGIALPVQEPRYLVEMDFPTVFRASSGGQVNWNGNVFVPRGLQVSGLGAHSTNPLPKLELIEDEVLLTAAA